TSTPCCGTASCVGGVCANQQSCSSNYDCNPTRPFGQRCTCVGGANAGASCCDPEADVCGAETCTALCRVCQ
ncbi:MAG: hypothetical protein JNM69_22530, partial [Archangium sp.]|nr:hypothetical protein [Archangium sp.]